MSIQHLETAAELTLHATSKLVLMALADDANKLTRITYPGMDKLVLWSGASSRRVQQIIEELIIQGYLARTSYGMPGRKAAFLMFPTVEEVEQLDNDNPDLNRVSDTALKRVMKNETKRATATSPAELKPVDNSQNVGETHCTHEEPNGCNQTPECLKPRLHPSRVKPPVNYLSQSLTHVNNEAVDNSDDDSNNHPSPKLVAPRRTLDTAALAASVGGILADTGIDDEQLAALGRMIISRSPSPVVAPTAYVTQAIRRHPDEWRSVALDLVAARTSTGGNPF